MAFSAFSIFSALFFGWICLAALYDYSSRTIPNHLNGSGLLLGIVFRLISDDLSLIDGLLGSLLGLGLLWFPFVYRRIGGGDVKFLAAAGMWLGPSLIFFASIYAFALAGLFSIFILYQQGTLREFLKQLSYMTLTLQKPTITTSYSLPFGIFLGITVLALYIHTHSIIF